MGTNPYTNWFHQSKPARSIVPVARFVSDSVFALKNGGYGCLFSLSGIDEEGLTPHLIEHSVSRIKAAIRSLPEGGRLYQYARIRRGFPIPRQTSYANPKVEKLIADRIRFLDETAGFRRMDLFWCLAVEPAAAKKQPNHKPQAHVLESNRLITRLDRAASTLLIQLSDIVGLQRLDKRATFSFFSYLLNLEEHSALRQPVSDQNLDAQLVSSAIAWRNDHLTVGKRHVRMFSLLDNPAAARPNLFSSLLTIDADLLLCSTWSPQPRSQAASRVKSIEQFQRIFANSLFAMAANAKSPENLEKTAGARAANRGTDNLADILYSIDNEGAQYGKYSLIGLIHSRSADEVGEAMNLVTKSLVDAQAPAIEETVGSLSAFYSMLPGNSSGPFGSNFNVRQFWLRDDHHATMSLVFAPHLGRTYSDDLEAEYLNVFETRTRTPYFLDPYVDSMRTLLVTGAPRTGKSVHGNQAIAHELKYGGFVYVIDIGGSYESVVRYYGGVVERIGPNGPRINPFSLPHTESNLNFLFGFIRMLLSKAGAELGPQDDDVIDKAVRGMYVIENPASRRLKHFYLPPHLERYMKKWKEGGVYGKVFDNVEDSLRLARIQAFDFEGITEDQKDVIEPLLFWILRQINEVIHDRNNLGVPKHILFDELWKQLENKQLLEMVLSSLKTGGKHLAGATLLTQSAEDLGKNTDLIVNACASKLFLPDPTFNRERYQTLFQLNDQELANLGSLNRGQHEALLKHGEAPAKVIRLNLDPKTYAMFSSKPKDRLARDKAVEAHGDRAFEVLTAKQA